MTMARSSGWMRIRGVVALMRDYFACWSFAPRSCRAKSEPRIVGGLTQVKKSLWKVEVLKLSGLLEFSPTSMAHVCARYFLRRMH